MENLKPFTPQLIWIDEQRIADSIKDYQSPVDAWNNFLPTVESKINRKLTENEKLTIMREQSNGILSILRPTFPFPNADDEFNLNALGLRISDLLYSADRIPGGIDYVQFVAGKAVVSEDTIDRIKKSCHYYTSNERQNEALEIGTQLASMFDKAESLGLVDGYSKHQINKIISLLDVPFGSTSIKLNHRQILELH